MPRFLALDWDQDRCQLLAGNVTRSGAKIERTLLWTQEEIFGQAQGEEAGKKLKEFLKTSGIAAGAVARVPAETTHPAQGAALPGRVRPMKSRPWFASRLPRNCSKASMKSFWTTPSCRASASESVLLATVVRKDLLAGYQALARAAGLKLQAVTPRPFVLADLLARCRKIDPLPSGVPPEWSAVLLLGQAWAELTILHGPTVCFARSMANDEMMESEVRRSVVMFGTQQQGHAPQILYLFGPVLPSSPPCRNASKSRCAFPSPCRACSAAGDQVADGAGSPAAVGLLSACARRSCRSISSSPKEPKPPVQGNQRTWLLAAAGPWC